MRLGNHSSSCPGQQSRPIFQRARAVIQRVRQHRAIPNCQKKLHTAIFANLLCATSGIEASDFEASSACVRSQFRYHPQWKGPALTRHLGPTHTGRVLDVEDGKESLIVGTVFCENIERPDIFKEIESDQVLGHSQDRTHSQLQAFSAHREPLSKIIKTLPVVYLEDESGRVEIDIGQLQSYLWVTGTTLGLRGTANAAGKFVATDVIEAGIPSQRVRADRNQSGPPKYVAIVSGLHYGIEDEATCASRDMLFALLNGHGMVHDSW